MAAAHTGSSVTGHAHGPQHMLFSQSPPQAWLASGCQTLLPWLTAASLCSPPPHAEMTSEKHVKIKSMLSHTRGTTVQEISQVTSTATAVLH